MESGQFPGTVVRHPVRSAIMRDANGKQSRVLYASQEDTHTVDRDMVTVAEQDGLDLSTAKLDVTVEEGQGFGRSGQYRPGQKLPPPPPRRRGVAVTSDN